MKKYAVIVAGGSGMRMGTLVPKQFLELQGKPLLWHTLSVFLDAFSDMEIILVLPETYLQTGREIIGITKDPGRIRVTAGGETRFQSVKKGLDLIDQHSIVFVHDGVRCLLSTDLITRCYNSAIEKGNAIPAVSAVDTIRIETVAGNSLINREKVRLIQTPQTFFSDIIKSAFEQDYQESFTDEASVVEQLGVKIHLIEGETTNIKITRPIDILIAEKILEEREVELGGRRES
jgi:2-C-methyl-D-erythritol 4-phosphate cytidylyltransferase